MTIPSGLGGKYLCIARGHYDSVGGGSNGDFQIQLYKNGSTVISNFLGQLRANTTESQEVVSVLDLVAGDYLEVRLYQTTGVTRSWYCPSTEGQFSVTYLGA